MRTELNGQTVVFTGQTKTPRAALKTAAERRGAIVRGAVPRDGDFLLVAGKRGGSKLALAMRRQNARIVTERQFLRAARGPIRRAIGQALTGAAMGAILGGALFAQYLV